LRDGAKELHFKQLSTKIWRKHLTTEFSEEMKESLSKLQTKHGREQEPQHMLAMKFSKIQE